VQSHVRLGVFFRKSPKEAWRQRVRGEILGSPIQCHTFDDAGQKTRLNSINPTLFANSKHHCRKFNRSLKHFGWLTQVPVPAQVRT